MADELFKVGTEGVAVSSGLPKLILRLLPATWTAEHRATHAIVDRILDKLRAGEVLDDIEMPLVEAHLGDQAARYARLQRIKQRSLVMLPQLKAPPGYSGGSGSTTADDWMNKFRDDAALVDDGVLQEVYARILAHESTSPGAIAMRTLGVLRYLDADVAQAFGTLQGLVVNHSYMPHVTTTNPLRPILDTVGLNYDTLLALEEAGLLHFGPETALYPGDETETLILHSQAMAFRGKVRDGIAGRVGIRVLTQAGRELASIAQVSPAPELLPLVHQWLPSVLCDGFTVASLPPDWTGNHEELAWRVWQEPKE